MRSNMHEPIKTKTKTNRNKNQNVCSVETGPLPAMHLSFRSEMGVLWDKTSLRTEMGPFPAIVPRRRCPTLPSSEDVFQRFQAQKTFSNASKVRRRFPTLPGSEDVFQRFQAQKTFSNASKLRRRFLMLPSSEDVF